MELSNLPKIVERSHKRLGRGIGSGKGGHTSSRGQKGQKARRTVPIYFTSGAMGASLFKQLPYLRGKGKFKSHQQKPFILNVGELNGLPKGTVVTIETLIKNNIVTERLVRDNNVKILGNGNLTVALTIAVPVSHSARQKIEKAGGRIGTDEEKKPVLPKKKQIKSKGK